PKIPRLVGGKQFFESTEGIPGIEEGTVRLVELSKNPRIVGGKRFFGRIERYTPGAKEGMV
ncbi:hypothetical protein A2U01_0072567, partial [Trifolium medium]|nr:hypothetical protein [Trifolium medium]